jgi:hypothetical protein
MINLFTEKFMLYGVYIVDQQMLAITLVRRVEKIAELKRCHHCLFHCKTYNSTKFHNLNNKFAKLKRRYLVQIVKITNLICYHLFPIYSI